MSKPDCSFPVAGTHLAPRITRDMNTVPNSSPVSQCSAVDQGRAHAFPPDQASWSEASRYNSFVHSLAAIAHEPLIVLDRGLRIVAASRSYRQMFSANFADAHNPPYCEMNCLHWDSSALELLASVFSESAVVEDHQFQLDVPSLGRRQMLLSARRVAGEAGHDATVIVGLEDITAVREGEDLKTALRAKQEMLLAEVHHRVANSLQIIASILLLKARSVKSDETRYHLHDVHHRIISVATVQRQLSVSGSGKDVELGPYLKVLCEGLANSMIADDQGVTIATSASAGTIRSEDAVSFGLIVTELVINALKHGYPDGREGRIVVEYLKQDGGWRLSVSDDGVGRSPDLAEPVHVGLGTSIVEALARNLGAHVEISPPGPGASTTIVHVGAV